MASFKDTVPIKDTRENEELNKMFQDSLFVSMEEFMERTKIKDTVDSNEISSESEKFKNIESEFAQDFGFNETDFLKAKKREFLEDFLKLDNAEIKSITDVLQKEEFADLYRRFSDDSIYSKNGEGPNCYAFIMDWLKNPITGKKFTMRPTIGGISGNSLSDNVRWSLLTSENEEKVKSVFVDLWKKDCEAVGKELVEVSSGDYIPKEGEVLTAFVYGGGDFHFYKKGNYNLWYHKPGILNPTTYDDSGYLIRDPKECNRGIYDHFGGYFVIRDKEI